MAKNIFPYELPENWQWSTLGSIASVKGGKRLPSGKKFSKNKTAYPYIRVIDFENLSVNLSDLNYIDYDTHNLISRYVICHQDIYISIAGSIGKVGIIPEELDGANLTENAAKITELRNINQKFLVFFLSSDTAQNQIKELTISTTQPKLALFRIKKILIPLPPLDEQKRIVAIIESLFEKLDAAKSIVQKILDGYELRRAAILHKAFIGELTKNFRADSGLTLDDWQEKKLGDVCQINPPKISTQNLSDDLEVSFFPMASLSEVEGKITNPQIKKLGEVKRGYTNFSEGDVVFAKITPCMENGKSAIIEKLVNSIGYGTTEFFVMRCSEGILNKFLHHLIRGKKFRDGAKEVMAGAVGQLRVPKNFLINYEINLPPLDEQKEIVRVLDGLLDKERRTKEITEKILSEIDLLKRTILARAFRGELGTNNPSEKFEELY